MSLCLSGAGETREKEKWQYSSNEAELASGLRCDYHHSVKERSSYKNLDRHNSHERHNRNFSVPVSERWDRRFDFFRLRRRAQFGAIARCCERE